MKEEEPSPIEALDLTAEYQLVAVRECRSPEQMLEAADPENIVAYWRTHIIRHPAYNAEVENLFVVLVGPTIRVKGHVFISACMPEFILSTPGNVIRPAIIGAAQGFIMIHNHPSGYSIPSKADVNLTGKVYRVSEVLEIPLIDHVIIGAGPNYTSFRRNGLLPS
jgi:DNA repair protein RadC